MNTLLKYHSLNIVCIYHFLLASNRMYFAAISLLRSGLELLKLYKTGSVVWSGSMDIDEERNTSSASF